LATPGAAGRVVGAAAPACRCGHAAGGRPSGAVWRSAIITGVHTAASDGGPVAAGGPELEAKLVSFVKEGRLPGAAAAAVHGDELAWSAAAGFADIGARRPSQPATLYRIASITKTFTGTAVMQLRDAGRLGMDDPAVAWLPELRGATSPFGPVEAVTIRRMLSHQSGLAAEPPGTDWAIPTYQGSPEQTLRRAGDIAITLSPGTAHKYSDLAYQLLGEIVTRASGTPYPRYLGEAILDPLGLSATSFEPLPAELRARCATGYGWRALADERDPAPSMPPV
jgi:CubicO group peptidase (beta-lactamase class C family)